MALMQELAKFVYPNRKRFWLGTVPLAFLMMHTDKWKTTDTGISAQLNVYKAKDSLVGIKDQTAKVVLEAGPIATGKVMHRTLELARDMPAGDEATVTAPAPQPITRDQAVDNALNPARPSTTIINKAPAAAPAPAIVTPAPAAQADAVWQKMTPGVYMQDGKTCVTVSEPLKHDLSSGGVTIKAGQKVIQHIDRYADCKRAERDFKDLPEEKGIVEIISDKWNSAKAAYNERQRRYQRDTIDEEGYPIPQGPGSLKDGPVQGPFTTAGQAYASTAVSPCYTVQERFLFIIPIEKTVCPSDGLSYQGTGNSGWSGNWYSGGYGHSYYGPGVGQSGVVIIPDDDHSHGHGHGPKHPGKTPSVPDRDGGPYNEGLGGYNHGTTGGDRPGYGHGHGHNPGGVAIIYDNGYRERGSYKFKESVNIGKSGFGSYRSRESYSRTWKQGKPSVSVKRFGGGHGKGR